MHVIYVEKVALGEDFFSGASVSFRQHYPTKVVYSHLIYLFLIKKHSCLSLTLPRHAAQVNSKSGDS
jgi:hypothetical protein